MKRIQMFILPSCPYCVQAKRWMDELCEAHPAYRDIPIDVVDEGKHPEIAEQYDYYYVPTYYVDGQKRSEGVQTKEKIEEILKSAL